MFIIRSNININIQCSKRFFGTLYVKSSLLKNYKHLLTGDNMDHDLINMYQYDIIVKSKSLPRISFFKRIDLTKGLEDISRELVSKPNINMNAISYIKML
jgi:hypothetical protein